MVKLAHDEITSRSLDFVAIANESLPRLYRRALVLTGSSSEAWDLVQSTFERALRAPPVCSSPQDMGHWLHTVLRNLFIDGCRARKSAPHVALSDEIAGTMTTAAAGEPAPIWQSFSLAEVRRLAEGLSPGLRAAFNCALEGLSTAEIAERLGILPTTVGTRLFRSRQYLRRMLEASQLEQEPQAKPIPFPTQKGRRRQPQAS